MLRPPDKLTQVIRAGIALQAGKKMLDSMAWKDANNLSRELLQKIDFLLRKNKLKPQNVSKMTVKSDIPTGYTSVRIAKTVAKLFNFAIKK